MPGESTEIIRDFAFDGSIGLAFAIGLGVASAFVIALLLWFQCRAIGRGWAGTFWLLRCTAVCLVLGMLLGPVWVTRHRTTKPQAIALIVDTSDSMDVSDPPENDSSASLDDVRIE